MTDQKSGTGSIRNHKSINADFHSERQPGPFAAHKNHIGFYPTPTGIEAFKQELSVYEGGKGAVRFPLDKSILLT